MKPLHVRYHVFTMYFRLLESDTRSFRVPPRVGAAKEHSAQCITLRRGSPFEAPGFQRTDTMHLHVIDSATPPSVDTDRIPQAARRLDSHKCHPANVRSHLSDLERNHHHPDIPRMPLLKRSPVILRRCHSTTTNAPKLVLGIRKEDPSRTWERRAPLTPDAVHRLVKSADVDILIQDCERRAFCTSDYVRAGARVHKTLEPAHVILGIKETPIDQVLTTPVVSPWTSKPIPRTHLMFSHTVKGQPYNMQLLSKFLAAPSLSDPHLLPRLIDYELLKDDVGKRTVAFGWFAGGQYYVTL